MFTKIEDALNYVMSLRNTKSNLDSFKQVCTKLNNPQDDFHMIHVAGTDGKGSTVTFLRDCLMSLGFKVGTFTSPHYVTHLDRIRVNNHNIPEDLFLEIVNRDYDFYQVNNLCMFEIDYLIMCEYFKKEKVDFAIVEVGLGGRLDFTNVVNNPKLSIITTIGYDHMDKLGDTLKEICLEKCGIIKNNSKVLIGKLDDDLLPLVKEYADNKNCKFYSIDEYLDLGIRKFKYHNYEYELLSYAKYQKHNACLAISALELLSKEFNFEIDYLKIKKAIKESIWNARFEIVRQNPLVILDGAHNIHGIEYLVESFDQFNGSKCIIFSALKRKEYQKMLDLLKKHADKVVITTFENNEVIDLNEFKNEVVNTNYLDAIDKAIKEYDNVLICGSLYFLSEVVLNVKF